VSDRSMRRWVSGTNPIPWGASRCLYMSSQTCNGAGRGALDVAQRPVPLHFGNAEHSAIVRSFAEVRTLTHAKLEWCSSRISAIERNRAHNFVMSPSGPSAKRRPVSRTVTIRG
jgi:hypothetical protein